MNLISTPGFSENFGYVLNRWSLKIFDEKRHEIKILTCILSLSGLRFTFDYNLI